MDLRRWRRTTSSGEGQRGEAALAERVSRVPVDALLVATVVLWSLDFTVQKYALTHGFEPLPYAALRFIGGAVVFVLVAGMTHTAAAQRRLPSWSIVGIAAASAAGTQACFSISLESAPASLIALLFGSVPAIVLILSAVLKTEDMRVRQWVASGVSFAGVALVVLGGSASVHVSLLGVALGLVAALGWAVHTIAVARLMKSLPLVTVATLVFSVGALPLSIVAMARVDSQTWSAITPSAWAALAYGVLLTVVLSNALWFTAVKRAGPQRSSLYANLAPFAGALVAVALLAESLDILQIIGGLMLVCGIFVSRGSWRRGESRRNIWSWVAGHARGSRPGPSDTTDGSQTLSQSSQVSDSSGECDYGARRREVTP